MEINPDLSPLEINLNDEASNDSKSYLQNVVYDDVETHEDATGILPGTEDYPGPLNFQLFLNTDDKAKRPWLYSSLLKKLYIDMNRVFCLQFKWKQTEIKAENRKTQLIVRALPVYASQEFLQEPVIRCPVHVLSDKSQGYGDMPWLHHVLRTEHHEAEYHLNPKSNRYSVVVPVKNPTAGSEFITIMYLFTCKTSCVYGFNRRPVHIIFTLETTSGEVLGRRKLLIKVCSCPKRDLKRDETLVQSETDEDSGIVARKRSKKTLVEKPTFQEDDEDDDDGKPYMIPAFPISGKRQYLSTLELVHGHLLGLSVRNDTLIDLHPIITLFSELIEKTKYESN